jgi:hypothetical protein
MQRYTFSRSGGTVAIRPLRSKPLDERNGDFSSTNFIDSGVNYNHNV